MHPMIKQALAYWEGLRNGHRTPRRADFDPCDIPRLLHGLVFFDVLDNGRDFRFRVIGDSARSVFFDNYTGQALSALAHVEADGPLMRNFRKAVQTGEPVRAPVEYVGPNQDLVMHDEVILPLANDLGDVTHLMVWVVLARRPKSAPTLATA